jgi:alkylhydroperoxidase family enzyme
VVDPEYGRVDNILRIHSLHPGGLRTHYELYREAMTGTRTLRKAEREMIALVVSVINGCHY